MTSRGWSLAEIARLCGGRLDGTMDRDQLVPYGAVSIDTRTLNPGDVFVAIRGDRDGHDFVGEACRRGAAAAVVDAQTPGLPAGFPLLRVEDTLTALQRWGAGHRQEMTPVVIAVTGSSGKTTTKDRLSEILATAGATHATRGNWNNHLGVPLTLLGLTPEHRYAVVEIAMNHPGEIAPLASLARPRHAVLTTVGWAHIGAFGTREAILQEKLGIAEPLPADGVFFHPPDPWLLERLPRTIRSRPRATFGLEDAADFHPARFDLDWEETRFASDYTGAVRLRTPGEGPLRAALAACLLARTLGLGGAMAREALEQARPRAMRMEPRKLAGAIAILDCYNASPESSLAAVDFLLRPGPGGRRWLVFGEMRELGARSEEAHRSLGRRAAGLDGLLLMGGGCRFTLEAYREAGGRGLARLYDDAESLAHDLLSVLAPRDVVLFKGSRATAMEQVYEACLRARPQVER